MKPEQVPVAAYIAHRVAQWRDAHGATQRDLADGIGIGQSRVHTYLHMQAMPNPEVIAKIARFLGEDPTRFEDTARAWWASEGRSAFPHLDNKREARPKGLAAFIVELADRWVAKDPAHNTLSRFAAYCGIHKSTLSHYRKLERDPDPETLQRIALFLGTTVEELERDAAAWWEERSAAVTADGMPQAAARTTTTIGGVSDEQWATIRQSAWDAATTIPEWMRDSFLERARRAELIVVEGGPPNGQDIADVADALYRVYERSRAAKAQ